MEIVIYGSRRQHDFGAQIRQLVLSLIMDGADVVMHEKLYDHLTTVLDLTLPGVRRVKECPAGANLAISVGGDGTLLRTVLWIGTLNMPVLGINTGHLGYLTALTLDEALAHTEMIVNCEFRKEKHSMLRVSAPGVLPSGMALNEIVVSKEESASMITARTLLNGNLLAEYKADGLIVSTPTGSTAYNLSVGGPIVEPEAPVWIVTPIAAHSLTLRPLVVSDDSHIEITVDGRGSKFRLAVDGRSVSLPMGTAVQIDKSEHCVEILRRKDRTFTDIIGTKLLFNS